MCWMCIVLHNATAHWRQTSGVLERGRTQIEASCFTVFTVSAMDQRIDCYFVTDFQLFDFTAHSDNLRRRFMSQDKWFGNLELCHFSRLP